MSIFQEINYNKMSFVRAYSSTRPSLCQTDYFYVYFSGYVRIKFIYLFKTQCHSHTSTDNLLPSVGITYYHKFHLLFLLPPVSCQ